MHAARTRFPFVVFVPELPVSLTLTNVACVARLQLAEEKNGRAVAEYELKVPLFHVLLALCSSLTSPDLCVCLG